MTPPVTIGLVGVGFARQVLAPAFRADPRCRLGAICARDLGRAQEAANALGIPRAYGDWRALVADPTVQVVAIAVPPGAQAEIAIAAARAGKHVFCEKPLALDAAQAGEMLDAAEAARVAHAVDFIFPEIPAWRKAKELLPAVGRIRHVALTWRLETYAYRAGLQNWKMSPAAGGGTLNNFVSHTFYYLEWLFGPVARLAASLRPAAPAADAGVELWLEFAAGFRATVSVAADAPLGPGHGLEIYGDGRALRLRNPTADYANGFTLALGKRDGGWLEPMDVSDYLPPAPDGRVWLRDSSTKVAAPDEHPTQDGRIAAGAHIASRFLDAALGGPPVTPGLHAGLRVQRLLDLARAADRTGGWHAAPAP
jgi:predicted dehydrogenase